MARILLGVSGGIAAYKALELVRLATAAGHAVRVIQTPTAQRFVGAASFAALTGAPVLVDEFERDPARGAFPDQAPPEHDPLSHLELVRNADAFLVAPASANTIAKLAHGLADNLLTSAALAARCPLVVAPAMNDAMWANPATVANVETLRARGVTVLEPGTGRLASKGEAGTGRLPEPPELLAAVEAVLPAATGGPMDGLRVLVSAGGTREPIDAVRFVGNRSSGRMGFALADEAAARGAQVTVVAANVALPRNPRVEVVDVETAAELQAACEARFDDCDVLLMAAAVADFRPAAAAGHKLKKDEVGDRLEMVLERTPDVLAGLAARRRPGQTLVGFAAETGERAVDYGRRKLRAKRLDAVVVNDVAAPGAGFDVPTNEVTIVTADGETHVPLASKTAVAAAVLDAVVALRAAAPAPGSVR
ncbi:MAG: bifunctional phosphopantothenoylcysteine decarboxylase/phosphopantothenate--cysteine ligase CoaBC [Solirubrobacteraceae bacterium]|nr:bifunctional phosphopantothenoylcysteine decarboxylase/phosphopantothenate--cysteine ligase CoaBC [Solirubrobacteraceae bacterium]